MMKLASIFLFFCLVSGAAGEKALLRGAKVVVDEDQEQDNYLRDLQQGDQIPGSYIIQFKDDLDIGSVRGLTKALEKIIGRSSAFTYEHSIKGCAFHGLGVAIDKVRKMEGVILVEPDYVVSIEGRQKPTPTPTPTPPPQPSQTTPWGITRVGGSGDGTGRTAWVIDTGIDLDHPDLNVDANRCVSYTGEGCDDKNGHGTHVAGTIAAINNNIGVVGVAAGAAVVPVQVLNRYGSGSWSGVIAGVDYVGANGRAGDVANMSLGGGFSQAVNDAVIAAAKKGIMFTLAAGNESTDAGTKSPASANGPNVYTISAMNSSGNWASFSNYGNPPVDYCAPGVSIYSTWKDGSYNTISGTSMAAPHAAGVLLLGSASTCGTVLNDPDQNADPIICR